MLPLISVSKERLLIYFFYIEDQSLTVPSSAHVTNWSLSGKVDNPQTSFESFLFLQKWHLIKFLYSQFDFLDNLES